MKNDVNSGFALVTGASSGIGDAMARQLAAKGYSLILTARRKDRLEKLAAELVDKHKIQVRVITADLSKPNAAETLYNEVLAQGLQVDILINNAGVGMQGQFLEMNRKEMEAMFHLNIYSLTILTQLFAREMKTRGHGYILQVASMAAFLPSAYVSAYAATKAYVLSFSEAVWYELKGSGVSVTTLYPGITTTEFNEVAHAQTPKMMNISIFSAETVAAIGLRAMFRRRRAVVPGFINRLTVFFTILTPRGWIIRSAGVLMKQANHQ